MANSNIRNCTATAGGAVAVTDQAILHVSGSSFCNNSAKSDGGVVYGDRQSRSFVQNSTFCGNFAGSSGAALSMMDTAQVWC